MRLIIEAIMRSEGMSEEDIAYQNLSLDEKRALLPNPLMPADKGFVIKIGGDEKTITLDTAAALCAEAIELEIITSPLPFPQPVKDLPADVYWQDVNQNFVSPVMNKMNGFYIVYLSDDTIYAKCTCTDKIYTVNRFLNLEETPELLEHIMRRERAVMKIQCLTPTWITEFNHELLTEHNEANKARSNCISDWEWLYMRVRDAKDPVVIARRAAKAKTDKALAIKNQKQLQGIKNLPFKWEGRIKEVLSGLSENSNGDGWKKNTVVHVRLLEDFKRGRFSRNKGDYLCSPKKTSNWGDGGIYDAVTCKSCLQRAAILDKTQGE